MAQLLKERHHLLALRVSRPSLSEDSQVVLELQRMEQGRNILGNRWELSAAELGAGAVIGDHNPGEVTLPAGVLTPLTEIIEQQAEDDEPLWLHLAKPYGVLGALDWERALGPHLNRAVLRLPDFLERSRENRETLNIALICDLPSDEPRFDLTQVASDLATAMLQASPRTSTRIHIFAARVWAERMAGRFDPNGPIVAHIAEPNPDGRLLTWLRWMEQALNGQSIDLVHFLAHAFMVEQSPALALTDTPSATEKRPTAYFVAADDIAKSLTRMGAWATGFSIPPDAPSRSIVRYVADNLAQTRPGPVFCHPIDGNFASDVASWIQFLFSPEPRPAPYRAGGFAYCQPELVEGTLLGRGLGDYSAADAPTPDPVSLVESSAEEPAWVSATKRFSETIALQSQRWSATGALAGVIGDVGQAEVAAGSAEPAAQAVVRSGIYEAAALEDTMRDLNAIVARHMTRETGG